MTKTLIIFISFVAIGCFPSAEGQSEEKKSAQSVMTIIMMLAFFGMFYALMIRPQTQQRKKLEATIKALKPGDKVIAAGILGTVLTVKDKSVTLRSGDSKLEVSKAAVEAMVDEGADKD